MGEMTTAPKNERPDPEWVRGRCPKCGEELVSHCHYLPRSGYVVVWECWNSRPEVATCDYRKML